MLSHTIIALRILMNRKLEGEEETRVFILLYMKYNPFVAAVKRKLRGK